MCLGCCIGLAAFLRCSASIDPDPNLAEQAIQVAGQQLKKLKADFPWEDVQGRYDAHVERLIDDPEFKASLEKDIERNRSDK